MLNIEHVMSVLNLLKEYDCDECHIKVHSNGDLVIIDRKTGECRTFPPEVDTEEALLQVIKFDKN